MKIREKIKLIPELPGVYLFKDSNSQIIYVGKAINLLNRIKSYFSNNPDPKIRALKRKISDIEYFITENEVEALLLENILIKKYQPKYNINLKDSKSYPLIKITKENLPRIIKCREKINEKDEYYGPFISAEMVKILIKIFSTVLKIRTCKKKIYPPYNKKPCLNYHISRCSAPCAGFITEEEYLKSVDMAREILKGNIEKVINYLKEKMENFSMLQQYEQAALIRDQIKLLQNYNLQQCIESNKKENCDYIGIFYDFKKFAVSIIQQRNGKVIGKENFLLNSKINDYTNFLLDFLSLYYLNITNIPPIVFIPEEVEGIELLKDALKKKFNISVDFKKPIELKDKKILLLAKQNAEIYYEEREFKIEKLNLLRELKKVLFLPKLPKVIEGIDIATLSGKYNIGSVVHFVNLMPVKSEYRLYNIQGYSAPDDYRMIEEVVSRRYQRLKNENKTFPDLILIDGGRGQLNTANNVLNSLNINIPVISIAKKEELIYLSNRDTPIKLPRNSQCLKAIQKIRDEAHRFCNSRIIKKQVKTEITSSLLNIKGIGKTRLNILLKNFGSISKIKKANIKDIEKLPGFNKELAKKVYDYINSLDLHSKDLNELF